MENKFGIKIVQNYALLCRYAAINDRIFLQKRKIKFEKYINK